MSHLHSQMDRVFFQISAALDNVRHVFVYLQRDKTNNVLMNPYIMDTFKLNTADYNSTLSNCKLEYSNGVFFPETEYDTESKMRIFNVMSYAYRKNDVTTGTQLNVSNYSSIFGLIYFDLRSQPVQITRDPKQLIFRYRLNVNSTDAFSVHAVVLYEEMVSINKVGN